MQVIQAEPPSYAYDPWILERLDVMPMGSWNCWARHSIV